MEEHSNAAPLASPVTRLTAVLERASRAIRAPDLRQAMTDAIATLAADRGDAFDALVVALNAFLAEHLDARREQLAATAEMHRVIDLLNQSEERTQAAYRSDRCRFVRLCAGLRMPAPPSWGEGDWTDLLDRVATLQALSRVEDGPLRSLEAHPPRTTWERLGEE